MLEKIKKTKPILPFDNYYYYVGELLYILM